ncbi:MAG: hypothetical protein H6733_01350 [Alphaproteobacteria bacterium]|nr:hypothetical protein [Alphaproteobacteria bacterium]
MNATASFASAVVHAVTQAVDADPRVVVITEGEGPVSTEVGRYHADRLLRMPIADRAHSAVAVGMAWGGRKVIVELAATGRLPALAEVLAEACQGAEGFAATVVVRVPSGGQAGRVDGTVLDLLAGIDGLAVVCPRDPGQVGALLRTALERPRPTVVLEPRDLARDVGPVHGDAARLGVQALRDGGHVTLIAWGSALHAAAAAAEALAGEGIDASVVDLVALAPLDVDGLGACVRSTGRAVVVADVGDHVYARRVTAAVADAAFLSLEAPPAVCEASVDAVVTAARAAVAY